MKSRYLCAIALFLSCTALQKEQKEGPAAAAAAHGGANAAPAAWNEVPPGPKRES